MSEYQTKPLISSLFLILSIVIFHRLPLNLVFISLGFNNYYSESFDKIITNTTSIIFVFYFIKKLKIPFKLLSFDLKSSLYYLPSIFFVIVFSGGFKDFSDFNFSTITSQTLITYTLKYFSSSFLEEFVFRGFILGIFILNFSSTKQGILKSVIFSGLIFGFMHFINVWTEEGQTLNGVINQIYAASCLGIMYGASYLKTRSILILGMLHFICNFFASISELNFTETINNTVEIADKSLVNMIISEILKIIIFGIPLVIGLYLIYRTNKDDLNKLNKEKYNLS